MSDSHLDALNRRLRAQPDYRAGLRFVSVPGPGDGPASYFYQGGSDAFLVCMRVAAEMNIELRRGD